MIHPRLPSTELLFRSNSRKFHELNNMRFTDSGDFSSRPEYLFGNEKRHSFDIGDGVSTIGELITHLTRSHITASHDKFIHEGSLRAGILVLINDCYWEEAAMSEVEKLVTGKQYL